MAAKGSEGVKASQTAKAAETPKPTAVAKTAEPAKSTEPGKSTEPAKTATKSDKKEPVVVAIEFGRTEHEDGDDPGAAQPRRFLDKGDEPTREPTSNGQHATSGTRNGDSC